MSIGISGQYLLRMSIGDVDILISPSTVLSISVVEYIDRLLPSFSMQLNDNTGFLTHILPLDTKYNYVTLAFADANHLELQKIMRFKIYQRFSDSVGTASNELSLCGLLDVKNMFAPQYERGWSNYTINNIIQYIGNTDLGIYDFDIDDGLDYILPVVQPNWPNALFLKYLQDRIKTSYGKCGFFTFVDVPTTSYKSGENIGTTLNDYAIGDSKKCLHFRSISSLLENKVSYKFVADSKEYEDCLPILNHKIVDNYEMINIGGTEKQRYGYFNYTDGEFAVEDIKLEDASFNFLSQYVTRGKDSDTEGLNQENLGRTSLLVPDFSVLAAAKYYKKINSLEKIWIDILGLSEIRCGQIIEIVFLQGAAGGALLSYQYAGYWLIERAVHYFSSTYITRLLLTRPGVDTDRETTLQPSPKVYGKDV